MRPTGFQHDLVVLTADGCARMAVRGIISRHTSLGIRAIDAQYIVHPNLDSGCFQTAHAYVRPYLRTHAYALVLFDREGCGREKMNRESVESHVEENLAQNGWQDRSAAIVFDPELEIWVWSNSPEVDAVLGWTGRQPTLRQWLAQQGWLAEGAAKPNRPKEAMEQATRATRTPWSSSLHRQIAERVSLKRCTDKAFDKFRTRLTTWFPVE